MTPTQTPRSIRVVVADDDAAFRTALTDMVADDPRFEVVGAVASGEEALALIEATSCDLVVMDVRMPGMGGVAAASHLRCRSDLVVVLVSASSPADERTRAGGALFLPKTALSPNALAQAWAFRHHVIEGGEPDARPR